jgi:type III restriction enzyme
MPQVIIPNPVLNSPFDEPTRYFFFDEDGITDKIVESRRLSSYFVPVPKPKKKGRQLVLGTEWTEDRIEENKFINAVRNTVAKWRFGGYDGVTGVTRQLLEYWRNPDRERRLYFCQIEALETAIYLTEAADRQGGTWISRDLKAANDSHNPLLQRIAFKMATGSGKTVVMAMLIAWNALNKFASPQDSRFGDAFLIVTPGITIRDRLRVLLPNDPENYYVKMDVVPEMAREPLSRAKILITNYHAFLPREKLAVGKLTKQVLGNGKVNVFTETPDEVVRRVCRGLGNKKNIVVINDEAHHCYRGKPEEDGEELKGDERKEAEKREQEARVWITGLESIKRKIGLRVVYDLSATPFFLKGSGYREGTLFPWVISDFSLIDAIEAGIVKVPRVPVADNAMTGEQPTYRELWGRIRDHLPKKGRGTDAVTGEPRLPAALEGALQSLYINYKASFKQWEQDAGASLRGGTPPVFIVVCNNTNVSKLVFDFIAGWEKTLPNGSAVLVPGKLGLFSNVADGRWTARPSTILVDSEQLESGEAMSDEFRKIAAREIEEFKAEYRTRFPERDPEKLTDEDVLREVMNTVGKPGKLGEQVRCVVSVSMLTEGWDANTVTHILGIRAFGTQLLCEQVVGRGLRRRNFALNEKGRFEPEYAEVYGVPFSFIPTDGSTPAPRPTKPVTRVRALEDRVALEMRFPRLLGYRYDLPPEKLEAAFTDNSRLVLTTADVPTETENAPIVGESSFHSLADLKRKREQEIDFVLARYLLETFFRDGEGSIKPWLFPELLRIVRQWRQGGWLVCQDDTFPQMVLFAERATTAAEKIYRSIVAATPGAKTLKPILYPYDTEGSTRYVDFDTTRPVYATDPEKCHISHVVADTDSWEQKTAQALESMNGEVRAYFKNHHVGFTIPYVMNGQQRNYTPDFVARLCAEGGEWNLILEVTGERRPDKEAKTATARTLWVPAVNNHGGFGRWAFYEARDPWNVKTELREFLKTLQA